MMTGEPAGTARALRPWRVDLLAASIALVPIAAGWVVRVFLHPRPFWIEFYDPETIHFYAGLGILRGDVPSNTDNPATPLQLASAAIEALGGMSTLDFDRFRMPAYLLGALTVVAGTLLFVRFVARAVPAPLAAASVWVYFLAPHALVYAAVWSPEILFFFAGSLTLAAIVSSWTDERSRARPLLAGVAIGFCCSVKFVFLAWAPAYVASLFTAGAGVSSAERTRRAIVAVAGIVAGFVLFTLPVISNYPAMFGWVGRILTAGGFYGHGGVGLPPSSYVLENLRAAVTSGKVFSVVFAVSIAGLVAAMRRAPEPAARAFARRALVFVLVASVLTWALALKHFNHRYLLPAALAAALAFVIAVRLVAHGPRRFTWITALVLLALVIKAVWHDVRTHVDTIRRQTYRRASIDDFVRADSRSRGITAPVVVYGDFPTPSFALRYFATEADVAELDRAFPREGTWGTNLFGGIRLPPGVVAWDYFVVQHRLTELYPESFDWIDRERTPFVDRTWIVRRGEGPSP